MKKLFLFVAVAAIAFSLNSCSKSDSSSSAGGKISFKVNGVSKTFTNAVAVESTGSIFVEAYIGSAANPTETVSFAVEASMTGSDAIYSFYYSNDTDDYSYGTAPFTRNVTRNTSALLRGTFSGSLNSDTSAATLPITEGSFDINR